MSLISRLLLGFFVALCGFLIVWKTRGVMEWVGRIDWAEEKFGSGGTYNFLRILGVIIIFIGFSIATDLINGIIGSLVGLFTAGG